MNSKVDNDVFGSCQVLKPKKTDKQKLEELLTEWGVEYHNNAVNSHYSQMETKLIIRTEAGDSKVKGHGYFYTDFEFDENGKFICMGIWE